MFISSKYVLRGMARLFVIVLVTVLLLTVYTSIARVASQAIGVEVGPAHIQQVEPGQAIVYNHVLTNTGTLTDTFLVDVYSTQDWPVELISGSYPTGTELLPIEVSPQLTASFQVSLTVPLGLTGVTEITIITATSQISPTIFDTTTDTSIVMNQIYLPGIFKHWPPIPNKPFLHDIQGADDGEYIVEWSESPTRLADTYTLQEATNDAFTANLRDACITVQQSCALNGQPAGTYYYRVRGENSWGYSEWSNTQIAYVELPGAPTLNPINNQDQDNYYTVNWQSNGIGETYILEESIDSSFSNPIWVYQGPNLIWTVPDTGKLPATYFYRVKAKSATGESPWSEIQSVTIYPLFVGLSVRWDGVGYIRGSEYYDIGWHKEKDLDILTEPDTIRSNNHVWYDPDPLDFGHEYWYSYYSVTTGQWKSTSIPGDPSWKWGYPWKLGYESQFTNGETITIDGQKFTVTGPHAGYTTWGKSIWYWEFVNQDKFLFWDGGGYWKQYVHAGDAILRYDAGNSRLNLYSNVLRHDYYQGDLTSDTVQYIMNLTSANSLPDSPIMVRSSEVRDEIKDDDPNHHPYEDLHFGQQPNKAPMITN